MGLQFSARSSAAVFALLTASACGHRSALDTRGTSEIPEGSYWTGSSLEERAMALEFAYAADPLHAAAAAPALAAETRPRSVKIDGFFIMTTPVTNAAYLNYVRATGEAEPWIDSGRWASAKTGYSYQALETLLWKDGQPQPEQAQRPVVFVDASQATSYCQWWGEARGGIGSVPSEAQWERSARGDDQRAYPWGNTFANDRAATLESRAHSPVIVGSPHGGSPFGVKDLAGNVLEWTRTAGPSGSRVVKGGSWNSPAIDARIAARHHRPQDLRHVALGFRCVLEPSAGPKNRRSRRKRPGR